MIYLFAVILGLAIGSFLNVCIYRIPRKGSVTSPKWSFCPHCEHTLGPLDNIPVLSYVFLRGKCRYCKERISPRYMIVELLTAGLFVLMAHKNLAIYDEMLPMALGIAATCIFAAMLVAMSFIDLEFTIIPNKIVYPGLVIGLLFAIAMAVAQKDMGLLISRLLGFLIGGVAILFIVIVGSAVFRKQAMGIGDVKLMAMIGIFLGPWPHLAITLMAASIFGTIVGVILIIARGKKMDSAIPFGPFLAIGALLSLLYGEAMWTWYQHITGLSG
jgi:leader peptidase (prepilin peptidase) / N-methyltransferase